MIKDFLTKKITRVELEKFIKGQASKKYTLDLGCANSPYSQYFPHRVGFDVVPGVGVDVLGDAHSLPFEDNKFDMVLCTEVLEHLHSPHVAIAEMNRVLKVGGMLILTTRFIFPLHDTPNDYFRYTKYGLQHLLREWQILELREEVGTQETIAVLLQRIAFQSQLYGGAITKGIIFFIAKIIFLLPKMTKREYGDIRKTSEVSHILASGYYVVCKKR